MEPYDEIGPYKDQEVSQSFRLMGLLLQFR